MLNSFKTFFYGFSRRQRTSLLAASWAVGLAGVLAGVVTFANVVTAAV